MTETKVINLRKEKCDVKICRLPDNTIPAAPNPGCFGNPFFLKNPDDDKERAEVIRKYRNYFVEKLLKEPEFKKAVLALKGKRLGCFCAPKPCHGDVIKLYLDMCDKGWIMTKVMTVEELSTILSRPRGWQANSVIVDPII